MTVQPKDELVAWETVHEYDRGSERLTVSCQVQQLSAGTTREFRLLWRSFKSIVPGEHRFEEGRSARYSSLFYALGQRLCRESLAFAWLGHYFACVPANANGVLPSCRSQSQRSPRSRSPTWVNMRHRFFAVDSVAWHSGPNSRKPPFCFTQLTQIHEPG